MILKNQIYIFIVISLVSILTSCYSPKIDLSTSEKRFADSLAEAYPAEVSIQHDYEAMTANRKDGECWIQIKNSKYEDMCAMDSSSLKAKAVDIASKLFYSLSHKQNYATIEIVFYKSVYPDKRSESTVCERHVVVKVPKLDSAKVTDWIGPTEKSNLSKPSDNIIN